jgi:hypothetical protein
MLFILCYKYTSSNGGEQMRPFRIEMAKKHCSLCFRMHSPRYLDMEILDILPATTHGSNTKTLLLVSRTFDCEFCIRTVLNLDGGTFARGSIQTAHGRHEKPGLALQPSWSQLQVHGPRKGSIQVVRGRNKLHDNNSRNQKAGSSL